MRIRLEPRLVNRREGDPGLFIDLDGARDALMIDCGSNDPLGKAELLRVSHVFVTHTHIDHFCGFDRLLRLVLGSVVHITVHGPPGLIENVRGKLAGYTWNLIDEDGPVFTVRELHGETVRCARFRCRNRFVLELDEVEESCAGGLVVADGRVRVHYAALEHGIPSFGYSVQEEPHAAVSSDRVKQLGLRPGPWIRAVQEAALDPGLPRGDVTIGDRTFAMPTLVESLVETHPGFKVSYVTDTVFNERTCRTVGDLARDSDVFFCEANYQEVDAVKAAAYGHLTARQAATFAREARAKKLVLFHFSRKYQGRFRTSFEEASSIFPAVE